MEEVGGAEVGDEDGLRNGATAESVVEVTLAAG